MHILSGFAKDSERQCQCSRRAFLNLTKEGLGYTYFVINDSGLGAGHGL